MGFQESPGEQAMSEQAAIDLVIKVLGGTILDPNRCEFPECHTAGTAYADYGVWCVRHRKAMVPKAYLDTLKVRGELPGGAS
jgi:hypothetical protein